MVTWYVFDGDASGLAWASGLESVVPDVVTRIPAAALTAELIYVPKGAS
jgi:hypothetical protein